MKHLPLRLQKNYSIPEFQPIQVKLKNIPKFKYKSFLNKGLQKKISSNKDDSQQKLDTEKTINHFRKRFSNVQHVVKEQFFNESNRLKSTQEKQIKIPKFILQKRLTKSDQIHVQKKSILKNDQKFKSFNFKRKINPDQQNLVRNETQLNQVEFQQSFVVEGKQALKQIQTLNEKSLQIMKSDRCLRNEFGKFNQSSNKEVKIATGNGFFVPKLTLLETNQIQEDFFRLFSSGHKGQQKSNNQKLFNPEQVFQQFLCVLN